MVTSDAAVLNRIRDGEREAFAVLFERYHERCARLAIRLLGDPDDAADAVQDAFVRAYLSLDSYQERDRFGSWLLCIVANRCRSAAETARRRASVADEWVRAHCDPELSTTQCEGDHALERHLKDALCSLPEATRTAVVRKYSDGLSYEQISADTGVEISALKMRVARGSAQLRRTLVSAGISIATIAVMVASHSRDTRKPRTATVVACDTLRAIMRDTLGAATRDSMLPAGRCGEDSRVPAPDRKLRPSVQPPPRTEF